MAITYIICAAGEGTRFQAIFQNLPKAQIRMRGRTFLEWSLQSLPILADDRLVIITQAKHRLREKMIDVLSDLYPFCSIYWHEIVSVTRGQLETAMLAKPYAIPGCPIVIYNCDTFFQSKNIMSLMNDPSIDGIIPCARAEGSSWSFCAANESNAVFDIREKKRISPWASVGLYYFRDYELFFQLGQEEVNSVTNGECYVSRLYKRYISTDKKIVMDPVHLFKPMGTPEQVINFWGIDMLHLKAENFSPVLVIDLDGTITKEDPAVPYPEKTPNADIIAKMHEFADAGWQIIIYTSRRMQTHNNDEARVIADISHITQQWLHRHNVPYNGLRFGKPYAHQGFYVDDKALSPHDFLRINP